MHPMEPVELSGDLVAIGPLGTEHAAGLLVAAAAEEVFDWLPYPRPADLEQAQEWIEDALTNRRGWGMSSSSCPARWRSLAR